MRLRIREMLSKKYLDENVTGAEQAAYVFERQLTRHIKGKKGQFLRDESGFLHLIIDGRRISLNYSRENYGLASLMMDTCGVSTINQGAQAAIQRLQVIASKNTGGLRLRRFAAVSDDGVRLYVPVRGGNLLISADGMGAIPNGDNPDSFWLEHPYDSPLTYADGDPIPQLEQFERLLVDTQACAVPAMRWFVAMAEGLFPFVRDLCAARLLTVHLGPSQCGKTTGARRFVILHGLGDVKGDFSVASLGNMHDPGLLVLDNKEHSNFKQDLIDYCLFLATGAERGRSNSDGQIRTSGTRPVGVITSIEGIPKQELQKRCAVVEYAKQPTALKLGPIERALKQNRDLIGSALMQVLRRYMEIKDTGDNLPNPIPEFEEHFTALCLLLMAYADVAGKSREWATEIIQSWDRTLKEREAEETDLEQPLLRLFRDQVMTGDIKHQGVTHAGRMGTLYVTDMGDLLTLLQKLNLHDLSLPKSASGLGRRLRSTNFQGLSILDENSGLDCLKRTSTIRPIGVFIPNADVVPGDAVTADDRAALAVLSSRNSRTGGT